MQELKSTKNEKNPIRTKNNMKAKYFMIHLDYIH